MGFRRDKFPKSTFVRGNAIRLIVGGLAAIATLMFGLLALFTVPSPSANTAFGVSGILVSISPPHPEYGDISIVLDGGRYYYINRANEIAGFDWEKMLSEVRPGDRVYLTAVTPLAWRWMGDVQQGSGPVAGIRTDDTVYLDAAIAAGSWTAQKQFSGIAIISLFVLIACVLPEFNRLFKQPPPASAIGV
jgi:hypothetical protein